MSDELKNILSNSNKDIDNQQLMDYLKKQLDKAELHNVEKNMVDDAFVNDAVEGLQEFSTTGNIQHYVEQLNTDLKKRTEKKKRRKEKRQWKDNPWSYVAILVVILLLIGCYLVIKQFLHQHP